MMGFLTLLFFAAAVGVFKPYIKNSKRWHFVAATVAIFVTIGVLAPTPTPEELAEKAAADAKAQQASITEKTKEVLASPTEYTRKGYPSTYKRIGKAMFARLNELEPGAYYAAAESSKCDSVAIGGVSDRSTKGEPLWFVDCKNGNRFMVTRTEAEAALMRSKEGKLVQTDLAASCTTSSIGMCNANKAQKSAKEAEIVTYCDLLLEKAVMSPSSLDKEWGWDYGMGEGDTLIVQRNFDSQNGFGAMIRSRYHCEVDAASGRITSFLVEGPMGTQKVI